jgi:hypothetical protein
MAKTLLKINVRRQKKIVGHRNGIDASEGEILCALSS